MKIILIGSYHYKMYANAFYNAWQSMGHEVTKIDYDDYLLSSTNLICKFHNRFQNRFHYGIGVRAYNKKIISEVKNVKPDFVFFYRCYHVWPETVKEISKHTICISYNNDDPFSAIPSSSYYRYFIKTLRYCSINYVYRIKNIVDYEAIGVHNAKVLMPYYMRNDNFYISLQKDIPLAFIGHYEADGRDHLIYKLKKAGQPINVFGGSLWKHSPFYEEISDIIKPPKVGDEYNYTINRIQIALVFLSKINHDTYTRRCFEIPVTKTLMLCEYSDDMNSLFPENECAVYFRNSDDLINKTTFLLNNPDEVKRIAENAYNRIMELGASEYDRCQQIIHDVYELLSN